jgi:hypothetical protein
LVTNLPLVKATGLPELKSRPALLPKYHIAASFCPKEGIVRKRKINNK